MKVITSLILLLSLVFNILGLPQLQQLKINDLSKVSNQASINTENRKKFNYASIQSQILATSLLKDNLNTDRNHIYSPLGISSILAVLAEASRGDTYKEFVRALGYPENKSELRESFKEIFKNFHQKALDFTENNTSPTFKTWLYIYRNNKANQDFKDTIKNCYSVDVKDINRTEFDWNEPDTSTKSVANINDTNIIVELEKVTSYEPVNSKDIVNFEDLKKSEPFENEENSATYEKEIKTNKLITQILEPIDTDLINKPSKFDSVVDDKQYIEVPVSKDIISKEEQGEKQSAKDSDMLLIEEIIVLKDENIENKKMDKVEKMIIREISDEIKNIKKKDVDNFNVDDNETIKDEEKFKELRKNTPNFASLGINKQIKETNEPEKIIIPIEKLDDDEIMEAVESRHFKQRFSGSRILLRKDDIASALSANSIIGNESPSKTKMLLFNGLYYRGNWAYPFQQLTKSKEEFYLSEHKSMPVHMMRARGKFQIGNLESLDSQAIVLPYENKRYSFVLIVPKEKDGLRKLIETIQPVDLQHLNTRILEMNTSICLPKFEVEETSRSETTLKKLGLKKIFLKYSADLGDLSDDTSLHVEEIVQHVNLRVDEGAASKNALSASNPSIDNKPLSRSDIIKDDEKSIIINRPFLYFVMDQLNDFIIVAGKITAPEFINEYVLDDD